MDSIPRRAIIVLYINNTCTTTKNFRISQISNPAFGRNEANHAKQLYCAIYMIAKNTCTIQLYRILQMRVR